MHQSETPQSLMQTPNLYETDLYAWTQEQATLLRDRQWSQIDRQNLIEEITALGKQRQELRHRLSVLLGQLLKWEYQAHYRSRAGWPYFAFNAWIWLNCWKIIPASSLTLKKQSTKPT